MTALGLYLMVSMFVIVAALFEFAVVLVMKHFSLTSEDPPVPISSKTVNSKLVKNEELDMGARILAANVIKRAWVAKKANLRKVNYQKIDRICFILFPSLFSIFNIIYFSYYNFA